MAFVAPLFRDIYLESAPPQVAPLLSTPAKYRNYAWDRDKVVVTNLMTPAREGGNFGAVATKEGVRYE